MLSQKIDESACTAIAVMEKNYGNDFLNAKDEEFKMSKEFPIDTEDFNPFGELIGLKFIEMGEGWSKCEIKIEERHYNPHYVAHGGVIYSLADTGMGATLYTLIPEDELCATIEIKIVYFKAVTKGTLFCETKVINKGKRIVTMESEIRNEEDELIAKALGTFCVFKKKS